MLKVLVVMGSDSDLPKLKPCLETLNDFGVEYSARVCSAHRTPALAQELAVTAEEAGYGVFIAAAGLAAHLAGVLAAYTS
ncbi:MAG: AIR carboxylase family protein, partial [Clostridiales bacterium]|nr:AIR carboxylase family protein [Clostridiales bacterium]